MPVSRLRHAGRLELCGGYPIARVAGVLGEVGGGHFRHFRGRTLVESFGADSEIFRDGLEPARDVDARTVDWRWVHGFEVESVVGAGVVVLELDHAVPAGGVGQLKRQS